MALQVKVHQPASVHQEADGMGNATQHTIGWLPKPLCKNIRTDGANKRPHFPLESSQSLGGHFGPAEYTDGHICPTTGLANVRGDIPIFLDKCTLAIQGHPVWKNVRWRSYVGMECRVNSNIAPPWTQEAKRTTGSAAPRKTINKASPKLCLPTDTSHCSQGHYLPLWPFPWTPSPHSAQDTAVLVLPNIS